MRKWLFLLGCTALIWGMAAPAGASDKIHSSKTVYLADVQIDPVKRQVSGRIAITFLPKDPKRAYLHLYPYAFTSKQQGAQWEQLLGKQQTLATYSSTNLFVDGKPVDTKRTGTILEVPLDSTGEKAGESAPITLTLDFEMLLPQNDGRMSYDEHAVWLGNWLPILAVYDEKGWHLDPYEPIGDPFYSETADYEVHVTLPAAYQLASSATDSAATVDALASGQRTYHLLADDVRDFALVIMDSTYKRLETQIGDTAVRTWWRNTDNVDEVKYVHEGATHSLAYFNSQFGTYPYAEYDVVRIGGRINGMEYPALVFLDGDHFMLGGENAAATIVHETAHQWFYGLIGNDQVQEAWLDEGFTEYATLAFLTDFYPTIGTERVRKRLTYGMIVPGYVTAQLRPWQELSAFPESQSYSDLVYSRTSSMLWLLRDAWGEERLHDVLHRYVETYSMGIADAEAWAEILSEEASEDASAFMDYWMRLDMSQQEKAAAWLERQRKTPEK